MKQKLVKDINTQTLYKFVKNDNLTGRGIGCWRLEVGSLSFEVRGLTLNVIADMENVPFEARYQHRHPGSCFLLRFARSRSDQTPVSFFALAVTTLNLKPQTLNFSTRPSFPVKASVLNCFGQVFCFNVFVTVKISYSPGYF